QQFASFNWLPRNRAKEYPRLLAAFRPDGPRPVPVPNEAREHREQNAVQLDHSTQVYAYAFSQNGERVLSGAGDNRVRLWSMGDGSRQSSFEGHTGGVRCVAWSVDEHRALSGADDRTMRLWDVDTDRCLRVFEGHSRAVRSVAMSRDGRLALSGSDDETAR